MLDAITSGSAALDLHDARQVIDAQWTGAAVMRNRLFAALPAGVQDRLLPHIEPVQLLQGCVVCGPADPLRYAIFPVESILSLCNELRDSRSVEVASVGNDGMVGVTSLMSANGSSTRAVVRVSGVACRINMRRLHEEWSRHDDCHPVMLRYTHVLVTQIAQTALCIRHHSIEQQFCRSLLMALDRLPGHIVCMTQEKIGEMLGVRRESITETARKLQLSGIIDYGRGRIEVRDRSRLERLSCECYRVVSEESARLLPRIRRETSGSDRIIGRGCIVT